MSIIERTTKLQLTQFEGSSINPAILDYYTADMAVIDGAFSDADTRLSALESTFQGHADRLDALEAWKTDTVDPTLSDYGTRIGALETWKVDTVTVELADHADRLTALETWKTDTVTVELASLDGRVDAIEQIIHDLSVEGYYDLVARLDALEAKVETNSNDITTLNANLTRLDNRLTEDEADIVNLGNGLVALANRVTLLEGCCEEVRGVLADHNTRINKNASDIAELDARLTRDEANISGNASDIVILANQNNTQSDQIQDLYDKYNSIDPDMPTNLYSRVGALETVVGDDALQTIAQTVTGAINELLGHATDVDADEVDYNNTDSGLTATDVQGAIDEVNGKVDVDSARVGALETMVGNAGSGLVKAVDDLSSESMQIQLSVSQLSASVIGVSDRVTALESTVGDATAGLVKSVADLETQNGSATLDTTAQTISEAINELNSKIETDTNSFTAKGLSVTLTKKNGWCYANVVGTLTDTIVDNTNWTETVPAGFIPSLNTSSIPNVPTDITNSLLNITFDTSGNIKSYTSQQQTITIGQHIDCKLIYPCA